MTVCQDNEVQGNTQMNKKTLLTILMILFALLLVACGSTGEITTAIQGETGDPETQPEAEPTDTAVPTGYNGRLVDSCGFDLTTWETFQVGEGGRVMLEEATGTLITVPQGTWLLACDWGRDADNKYKYTDAPEPEEETTD